jgi:hypothetical protein
MVAAYSKQIVKGFLRFLAGAPFSARMSVHRGKTGSGRRTVKVALMTHTGSRAPYLITSSAATISVCGIIPAKYLSSLIISSNLGLLDRDVGRLHPSLAPMTVREWRAVHETMQ